MIRILTTCLLVSACTPEEVIITPTRLNRESCTTRWSPCIASEDANGDGVQNTDESWSGMCTAVDQCTACTGPCATLVFVSQPAAVPIGAAMTPMMVELHDPVGATIETVVGDVAINLETPPSQVTAYGTLLAALAFGRAVFNDVRISRVAADLQLSATWEGAAPAISDPFAALRACANGTIGYWPLDETTGTSFADIAGTNDAACTTCPAYNTEETAWQFDGSTGIDVAGGAAAPFNWNADEDLAVELWLLADAAACTAGAQGIVGRDGTESDPQHWWVGCRDNRRLNSWWRDTSNEDVGLQGPVTDTRWHHLVFQRQVIPPRRQLLVDGELVAVSSVALGAYNDPEAPGLNIGWLDADAGYHFQGHVAHLAIYDRTLPRSEIMAHRNLGRALTYCDAARPVCGDGHTDVGEDCDDGNVTADDGCSPLCVRESRACPADLLSYWRLDGVGLERFDDAVGDQHLDCSFYGSRTGPDCPAATAGIIDGGQELDGATHGLEVTAPGVAAFDFGPEDSFSIEAWMRPAADSTCAGNQVVVGRRQETPSAHLWLGCVGSDGSARAEIRDADGTTSTALSGPVVTDNAWHHLVLMVDAVANTVSLFVDGAHAETAGIVFTSGFALTDEPLEIGRFDARYNFEGTIDAVAIYGRALHPAEATNHWADGAGADICTH